MATLALAASYGGGACSSSEPAPAATTTDGNTDGGGGSSTTSGSGAAGGFAIGGSGGGTDPLVEEIPIPDRGISASLAYEQAYDNVAAGDWYRDDHNETATLAWGEAYVMMSLAAMFRATGSVTYLDRLVWHADSVLAQRDDARGVQDYRGVSGACWQNRHYQPNDEPYCYVVHSGMIGYPLVELARLVSRFGLEAEPTYDGQTLGDKASAYVAAARQTVAYHDDQYDAGGAYRFRSDATFLPNAGVELPLNQSNAMGRLLLALYERTGEAAYLAKATALAQRFAAQLSTGPGGEYRWNYWGGTYASPGEDISHAAINVDFARQAAEADVVFDAGDLEAFAKTFVGPVYLDDRTLSDHVGGGAVNGSSYRAQAARWLRLSTVRATIYTAIRDIYDVDYPPGGVASGSLLYGWALLAELEPIHCEHFFYHVDWNDPQPSQVGDWREATAYGANVLTTPPDLTRRCMVPLEVNVPRSTDVEQYDGNAYHTVAVWQPTAGPTRRHVPFEPRWPHLYWQGGVLYQFADSFVAGNGIEVRESEGVEPPTVTSSAPTTAEVGVPVTYTPSASGDGPLWWSLSRFPVGARVAHDTGAIDFTPPSPGAYPFTLVVQNDWGSDEQTLVIDVP